MLNLALRTLLQPVLATGAQVQLHPDLDPTLISRSGCIHVPDPGLHHWSWLRADGAANRFSLTESPTPLLPSWVMQGLEQLVTAPLEPWDALVCTSRSALQVVKAAMTCMHERLERRFQQTLPPPRSPASHTSGNRSTALPLARDDLPIARSNGYRPGSSWALAQRTGGFISRSPELPQQSPSLPLYRALERLSAERELVLLECGHIFNADISAAYDQLKQRFPRPNAATARWAHSRK